MPLMNSRSEPWASITTGTRRCRCPSFCRGSLNPENLQAALDNIAANTAVTKSGDTYLINDVNVTNVSPDIAPEVQKGLSRIYNAQQNTDLVTLGLTAPADGARTAASQMAPSEAAVPVEPAPLAPVKKLRPRTFLALRRAVVNQDQVNQAQRAVDEAQAALASAKGSDAIQAELDLRWAREQLTKALAGNTDSTGKGILTDMQSDLNAAEEARVQKNAANDANLNGTMEDQLRKSPLPTPLPQPSSEPTGDGSVINSGVSPAGREGDVSNTEGETAIATKTEITADPEVVKLVNRAGDLKTQELLARVRGDAQEVAQVRAQRGQVLAELDARDASSTIRQLQDLKSEALKGSSLFDEENAVRKQEPLPLSADEIRQKALAAMDRAAAEREVLAQYAENLANGGKDWTQADIEKMIQKQAQEYQQQRESPSNPDASKPIDNVDSTRARIDQAIKDTQTLRDLAVERSRLYSDQAEILKDATQASSFS